MGLTNISWQGLSSSDDILIAFPGPAFWRALFGRSSLLGGAPFSIDEFPVVTIGDTVPGNIAPQEAGAGVIDIGLAVVHGIFIGHGALVIVGALFSAIRNLPGALVVVAGDGGCRPDVAVA